MKSIALIVGLSLIGFSSLAWVNEENASLVVNTNATAIATNGFTETGYFRQINIRIPAGITSETFSVIDQFTGATLLSTNKIGAPTSGIVATNITLWNTNLIHGTYVVVQSSVLASNGTPNLTNTLNLIEDR